MAETLQRIELIGHVTEPQMRYTAGGVPVTNFSIAVKKLAHKSKAEECPKGWKQGYSEDYWELTTWYRITCWRYLAEQANDRLEKGHKVYVEGEAGGNAEDGTLGVNIWTGKDGKPRASLEVVASKLVYMGKGNGNGSSYTPSDDDAPPLSGGEDIKLPF